MKQPRDRRTNADRRHHASRRRHANAHHAYIELCRSKLRVAIVRDEAKDEPRLTTQTVHWRADAPDLQCKTGLLELTAALRGLVNEHRLAGCSVSFAINSTLCVNRAASGPNTRVEQMLETLEERSQLYLSLGPGPKLTAIGRKQIDARHEHALMTVANEATIELLVSAAEAAGLVVNVVESSLVSLSRLHGVLAADEREPVMIAQLDEDRFEIGVVRADQLLVEYRPPAETSVTQLGSVIDTHHGRLERFCRRQYGLGSMDLRRLWLVGDVQDVSASRLGVKTDLENATLELDCIGETWRLDEDVTPTTEMAAVVGLALLDHTETAPETPNLMEQIHARAKTPLRPALVRAATPIAASLLLALGMGAFNFEQRVELSALREEVAALRPAELRLERLGERIRSADVEIEHLGRLTVATPPTRLDPLVAEVAHCLPDDVWLKQFRLQSDEQALVSGASYTEGGVYDLVSYLQQAPSLAQVALQGTGVEQTRQGPATSFDIDLELTPPPARQAPPETGASTDD